MPPKNKDEEKKQQDLAAPTTLVPSGQPGVPQGALAVRPQREHDAALDIFTQTGERRIMLPRIVVLQAKSGAVERSEDPERPGTFYNILTQERVGQKEGKEFHFIPIHHYTSRLRIDQTAGLVCRSADASSMVALMPGGETYDGQQTTNCAACKYKDWPNERVAKGDKSLTQEQARKGPQCSLVKNFPALLVTGDDPADYELVLLSFSRTSTKAADALNTMQLMTGKTQWHYFKYKLNAREAMGGPTKTMKYFKQDVARAGKTSEAERARADEMLAMLRGKIIGGDEEGAEDDEHSTEGLSEAERTVLAGEPKF